MVFSWVFVRVLVDLSQFPGSRLQNIYSILNTKFVVETITREIVV